MHKSKLEPKAEPPGIPRRTFLKYLLESTALLMMPKMWSCEGKIYNREIYTGLFEIPSAAPIKVISNSETKEVSGVVVRMKTADSIVARTETGVIETSEILLSGREAYYRISGDYYSVCSPVAYRDPFGHDVPLWIAAPQHTQSNPFVYWERVNDKKGAEATGRFLRISGSLLVYQVGSSYDSIHVNSFAYNFDTGEGYVETYIPALESPGWVKVALGERRISALGYYYERGIEYECPPFEEDCKPSEMIPMEKVELRSIKVDIYLGADKQS
ncbi:MAG: hypothetical protein QXG98_02415 [Candidatus Micrarchaeia archaeon]